MTRANGRNLLNYGFIRDVKNPNHSNFVILGWVISKQILKSISISLLFSLLHPPIE